MENKSLKKEISLFMATMLVCGNMIGSGVFMLPSTLAQVAGPGATVIAWILTTVGSILIAISLVLILVSKMKLSSIMLSKFFSLINVVIAMICIIICYLIVYF